MGQKRTKGMPAKWPRQQKSILGLAKIGELKNQDEKDEQAEGQRTTDNRQVVQKNKIDVQEGRK